MAASPIVDLRIAGKRVLDVVNQMLCHYFWETRMKNRLPQDEDFQMPCIAIHNATVESSLMSLRILDDVFACTRKYPGDLHQSDFPGFVRLSPFLSQEHRKDIDQRIAHLNHPKLIPGVHGFPYKDLLRGATPVAEAFCQYLGNLRSIFNVQDLEYVSGTSTVLKDVAREYINA